MAESMARGRLTQERKDWIKDHPHGFFAKPARSTDGSVNLMKWECGIPGKAGTSWEGAVYKIDLLFTEDYPMKAPRCMFKPPLFHPNLFTSGDVCLSILKDEKGWLSSTTVPQILMGIQDLLDTPNLSDPANGLACDMCRTDRAKYEAYIKKEAAAYALAYNN